MSGQISHGIFVQKSAPEKSVVIRQLILSWFAVAIWAAVIYYFSAQPSLTTTWGLWDFILRKAAHFTEFAILCFLLWRAIKKGGASRQTAVLPAAMLSLLYAFSDEFHQRFVTGRTSSIRDVGFDLAGILAASLTIWYLLRRRHLKQAP